MPVTTNDEQRLFVIPCNLGPRKSQQGYTCLGFDVCRRWSVGIAKFLRANGVRAYAASKARTGTLEAYERYRKLCDKAQQLCTAKGIRCNDELTPQLIGKEGCRVEVEDKHGDTRRFWVGKSTGWRPCHLEVHNRRSTGGPAVMGAPFKRVWVVEHSR